MLGIAIGFFAAGWYFSDVLRHDGLMVSRDRSPNVQITSVDRDRVTLAAMQGSTSTQLVQDGIWGLEWPIGYAQLGPIIQVEGAYVVRPVIRSWGQPLTIGMTAYLDNWAFPTDPRRADALPFEDVTFESSEGVFKAWLVPGNTSSWAILVHGQNSQRPEFLRILPTLARAGLSSLVIEYRNDPGEPAPSDGYYRFGATEWLDLQAAAQYALDHGARHLVLVGNSMGAAIVMSFLYHSPLADRAAGVVLDSPLLDFSATVQYQARGRGIPDPISNVAKLLAAARFGIDWRRVDYLRTADQLNVPVLLFHGENDKRVPRATSDALFETRPDLVTYVPTPGADHVRAWNVDSAAYTRSLETFLARLPFD